MMETELVSEMLVFDLTLTRLYAQGNFITLIRRESFKSYILLLYLLCHAKQHVASC
jgi:hypothetical protein